MAKGNARWRRNRQNRASQGRGFDIQERKAQPPRAPKPKRPQVDYSHLGNTAWAMLARQYLSRAND